MKRSVFLDSLILCLVRIVIFESLTSPALKLQQINPELSSPQVSSRRSRLSNEADQDADSSEDEGEKSNLWLRTLLRSSINEHSTSSSMFVEIGSPPLPAGKVRTPSPVRTPVIVPQTVQLPRVLTIHSQALQVLYFSATSS